MSKKKTILEKLSINDTVIQLTNLVTEKLIDSYKVSILKRSPITNMMFKEETIEIDTSQLLKTIEALTLHYIVYVVHDVKDIERARRNSNCEASYEDKEITIKTVYLFGYGFVEPIKDYIIHEVEHIFQYDSGFKKSANLDELYNKLVEYNKNGNKTPLNDAIFKVLYYSFSHEQDAYTNQFYQMLQKKRIGTFEEEINSFPNYVDFINSVNILKDFNKNDIKEKVEKQYNISLQYFNRRLHYAKKRFITKLANAYKRRTITENDRLIDLTNIIRKDIEDRLRLTEIYGDYLIKKESAFDKCIENKEYDFKNLF